MKIINPSYEIMWETSAEHMIRKINTIARTCYKSNTPDNIESQKQFIRTLIKNGHEAMIEHVSLTVKFICDRGVSHELVRHRLASFAQESTRYCNYGKDKFGNEITFIQPPFFATDDLKYFTWKNACEFAECTYLLMVERGVKPQEARSILPNSTKTEIWITATIREWRHILQLRTAPDAHPQMRELMCPLLNEFKEKLEPFFFDISYKEEE